MSERTQPTRWRFLVCLWGCLGCANLVGADTLQLEPIPLSLTLRVQPNLLFLIDDSESMDWEAISKDVSNDGRFTGLQKDGSVKVKHRDNDGDGVPDCGFGPGGRGVLGGQSLFGYAYGVELPSNAVPSPRQGRCNPARDGKCYCNVADDAEWRFRNADANPLYFNPTLTYAPWAGVDANGRPFTDMPVTAAKDNPYDPRSRTLDLTRNTSQGEPTVAGDGFRYYTWQDLNTDGIFDDGEETVHFIRDASPAVQQNFANWFSFYRKRSYVVKAVYGQILANLTGMRTGLVTFHNNADMQPFSPNPQVSTINLPLQDIDLTPVVPKPATPDPSKGTRRTMLDALYSFRPQSSTPIAGVLTRIGEYLEDTPGRFLFPNDHEAYLPEGRGGECQQSFVVAMTDGLNTGGVPFRVGNADSPRGPDGRTPYNGGPYGDNFSNTLGDVAMHYYQRDLRPDLPDRVPTSGADTARHQHMVTYTVTFSGFNGTLTKNPDPDTDGTTFWPRPAGRRSEAAKVDDLRHAAFNGRGLFLQSNDPASLSDALQKAITNIAQRTSSAVAVALNTGARGVQTRLFQARFDSGDWSGQLLSIPVDPVTGEPITAPDRVVDSGALLDQRLKDANYNTNVRTILTYKPSQAAGIPFQWSALDTTQQQDLNIDPVSKQADTQGIARLNYIRGSNANEGKGFRSRVRRLGDIINSDPAFVGPPELPNEIDPGPQVRGAFPSYADFRDDERQQKRPKMIMAGSNDGMFHIFNANNPDIDSQAGQEMLAYVPHRVLKKTPELTAPTYTHSYYVDGSPTAADVFLTQRGWRTVVVSGLGTGGQAFFALDITTPGDFQETADAARKTVLWEFSDLQDADLGYALSQPSVVRMANGQWAAVVGSGYNNTEVDGLASKTGHAAFFVIFLDGPGADGKWIEGTHYIKIDTGVGTPTAPNGLATPAAVDLDGDFTIDYLVAGDLEGNLWRVDVTSRAPQDWSKPANLSRLFVATDGKTPPTPQPITTRPEVGRHPENLKGFVVYFGTGKYLEKSDNVITQDTPIQTFYGIWDKDLAGAQVARGDLLRQTVLAVRPPFGRETRVTSDNPIDWQQQRGFFLDLPAPGERQVSDAVLRSGQIVFSTLIPSTEPCSFGGSSFIFSLDVRGGRRPAAARPFFDVTRDGQINQADQFPLDGQLISVSAIKPEGGIVKTPTLQFSGSQSSGPADALYVSNSDGTLGRDLVAMYGPVGRQAWRKITQ